MELGTLCARTFKIIGLPFFSMIRLTNSIEAKTALLFRFFNFHAII
jgi:hypothetical protein